MVRLFIGQRMALVLIIVVGNDKKELKSRRDFYLVLNQKLRVFVLQTHVFRVTLKVVTMATGVKCKCCVLVSFCYTYFQCVLSLNLLLCRVWVSLLQTLQSCQPSRIIRDMSRILTKIEPCPAFPAFIPFPHRILVLPSKS